MLALLAALSLAEVPLPSWREEVVVEEWYRVNQLIEDGRFAEARARSQAFRAAVTDDARLHYLEGLTWRAQRQDDEAARSWLRTVELDPDRRDAWYDLGELAMGQGRFAEADRYFEQVERLVDEGPLASIAPRRRAECAALLGDDAGFERHLREALRRGFSFNEIAGNPTWQAIYRDPTLRGSVEKMITVYGNPQLLLTL
ncbi:MAG: tetratricopeptide repeat protein [Deltaproteobacteria bacterium]|nr:tetratricopeptide repeat protein [Deltaproteobacteria bacterium]